MYPLIPIDSNPVLPPVPNLGAAFQLRCSSNPPYCLAALRLTTNSPGSSIAGTLSPEPLPGTHTPFCA